ncbi:serine/threonine-protein phosphatase 1 regulatory subunit 10-like [Oncorhynchus mykiss]|uniref:serine/threonine-protein phosphatase 1 regulatory subunit 10-like n=1 Tax=Oncorhynchus mykiss TaxID=8022 RepID=UPI001877FFC0|nr:serine/threonine-protein phosphatase 1 regulatory subunit 10-like [Oncorhynchus mykiss]
MRVWCAGDCLSNAYESIEQPETLRSARWAIKASTLLPPQPRGGSRPLHSSHPSPGGGSRPLHSSHPSPGGGSRPLHSSHPSPGGGSRPLHSSHPSPGGGSRPLHSSHPSPGGGSRARLMFSPSHRLCTKGSDARSLEAAHMKTTVPAHRWSVFESNALLAERGKRFCYPHPLGYV